MSQPKDFKHFTGKKTSFKTQKRKKKVKVKRIHKNKYERGLEDMAEDKKEKKPEKIISNLKNGTLMKWDTGYGSHRYFLEKENGEEIYLRDIISYLAFGLSGRVVNALNEKGSYEEGREEKDIISTLNALVNAYNTGLF